MRLTVHRDARKSRPSVIYGNAFLDGPPSRTDARPREARPVHCTPLDAVRLQDSDACSATHRAPCLKTCATRSSPRRPPPLVRLRLSPSTDPLLSTRRRPPSSLRRPTASPLRPDHLTSLSTPPPVEIAAPSVDCTRRAPAAARCARRPLMDRRGSGAS
ncbi:hypothetical protein FB451DRAFT_129104 [Mycena latifolia]|nr:hypothetical protein FB451DRAFT_129104 [Mycena latifolia]